MFVIYSSRPKKKHTELKLEKLLRPQICGEKWNLGWNHWKRPGVSWNTFLSPHTKRVCATQYESSYNYYRLPNKLMSSQLWGKNLWDVSFVFLLYPVDMDTRRQTESDTFRFPAFPPSSSRRLRITAWEFSLLWPPIADRNRVFRFPRMIQKVTCLPYVRSWFFVKEQYHVSRLLRSNSSGTAYEGFYIQIEANIYTTILLL